MAKALKKPKKKTMNGYRMPEPLPEGEIFTDINKNKWKLGPSIGKGGFGEIYSAQDASKPSSKYTFVIKVEPHENGPLFVEMHFYMKNAKKADIEEFKRKHKLKTFGMPAFIGSGSHEVNSIKYRFIVMEKFGTDIDKLRRENNGILPVSTVFHIAWQMLYVLEYIHNFGYVHADIKGANVLIGASSETKNQAYLIDFGLATKFSTEKEFKPNPKKAHDGTIEYLSRDAHQGVQTRRGDLEILAYNMILWLCNKLPWEAKLENPVIVQQMKEDCMKDIPNMLHNCFHNGPVPNGLVEFLKYINKLKFNEAPNYKKMRDLFNQEIETNGSSLSSPLEFSSVRKRRSSLGRETPEKKSKEENAKKVPKRNKHVKNTEKDDVNHEKTGEILTAAMKEIIAKRAEKEANKKRTVSKSTNGGSSSQSTEDDFENCTAEMVEIQKKIAAKEKKEKHSRAKAMQNGLESQSVRPRRNVPTVNYHD